MLDTSTAIATPGPAALEQPAPPAVIVRVLEIVGDGRPWRVAHLVDALVASGAATGDSAARQQIARARELGHIRTVRHGVVVLASAGEVSEAEIPPLHPVTEVEAAARGVSPGEVRRQAILEIMADGHPHRAKNITDALIRAGTVKNLAEARAALEYLRRDGQVDRIQHGVFIRAGSPLPAMEAIPPLHPRREPNATEAILLDLLGVPRDGVTLTDAVDVSRQRVHQILDRLVSEGAVRRFEGIGTPPRTLWLRADVDPAIIRQPGPGLLDAPLGAVLAALVVGTEYRTADVAEFTGLTAPTVAHHAEALAKLGLVAVSRFAGQRQISLTEAGAAHPARIAGALRAVSTAGTEYSEVTVAALQALVTLGTASTMDVTDAVTGDEQRRAGMNMGQVIAPGGARSGRAPLRPGRARPARRLPTDGVRPCGCGAVRGRPTVSEPGRDQGSHGSSASPARRRPGAAGLNLSAHVCGPTP